MTQRMATRLAAARLAVLQACAVAPGSVVSESWWQAVAQAEQHLADVLFEQAQAITKVMVACSIPPEDDPIQQLRLAVYDAAYHYEAKAKASREHLTGQGGV